MRSRPRQCKLQCVTVAVEAVTAINVGANTPTKSLLMRTLLEG
jgi:hypothetical protein